MAITFITSTAIVPNRFEIVTPVWEQIAICDTWAELQSLKPKYNRFMFIDHMCGTHGEMADLPSVDDGIIEDWDFL